MTIRTPNDCPLIISDRNLLLGPRGLTGPQGEPGSPGHTAFVPTAAPPPPQPLYQVSML